LLTTDYSKIAPAYDANPIRRRWEPEPAIAAALAGTTGPVLVLDLACGTGNFLAAQRAAFSDPRLVWHGCDLAAAMLEIARTKLPGNLSTSASLRPKPPTGTCPSSTSSARPAIGAALSACARTPSGTTSTWAILH
jgi:SAM-dependent methyltransferase